MTERAAGGRAKAAGGQRRGRRVLQALADEIDGLGTDLRTLADAVRTGETVRSCRGDALAALWDVIREVQRHAENLDGLGQEYGAAAERLDPSGAHAGQAGEED